MPVADGLQPFIGCTFLYVFVIGQVLEPTVFRGAVPMLDFGRDGDHGAGSHRYGLFPPLLLPAADGDADQHLHLLVVDMRVVAAAGLESDIGDAALHRRQIAVAREILGIGGVRFSLGPDGKVNRLHFRSVFRSDILRIFGGQVI